MSPRVSVIIPAFNSEEFVNEAIESVLNQSFKDYELIVVNDGSTDQTEDIIKRYITDSSQKFKYIKQENKGLACARNAGINMSSGEFIAFLDSDDVWLPDKLFAQVSVFDGNPHVGLVHTNSYGFGGPSGTYLNRYWMTPEQIAQHSGDIFLAFYFRKIGITASTVMMRRDCLEHVGPHDEFLSKLGCEDRELFLRIIKYYPAVFINKPLAKYRDRSNSMGKNLGKMLKGQHYTYQKITDIFKLPHAYKRKALSTIYYEWSSQMYDQFDFVKGIELQLQSIRFNPLNLYSYKLTGKMMKCIWNYFTKGTEKN